MSCLSIIQKVSRKLSGFAYPNAAVSSTDPQIQQLLALLNDEGQELARRPEDGWQALVKQATFTSTAVEIQGELSTIAPDMKYIVDDTIWNLTYKRPIFGSLSAQEYARQKGWFTTGIYPQYRINGGNILFVPAQVAGDSCSFEYQSKSWATNGVIFSSSFLADADISLLDEDIMALGLVWRWKAAKGFDYAEDFVTYERAVSDAIARDVPRQTLNYGRSRRGMLDVNVQESGFGL